MKNTIQRLSNLPITKLYRQAWFLFDRDLITKEELNQRLKLIAEIRTNPKM